MKRIIALLSILILSTQSFSQHYKPTVVNTTFLNKTEEYFRYMWFSDDNQKVYANDKTITVFDIKSGNRLQTLDPTGHSLHAATSSNDGSFWIQGNYRSNTEKDPNFSHIIPILETYNLKTGKFEVQSTEKTFISKVILSSESNFAYGCSSLDHDEEVVKFQINPFKISKQITDESGYILGYSVNETTNKLAYSTGGKTAAMKIVDIKTGAITKTLFKGKEISQIRYSSDGKFIFASASSILYKVDTENYSVSEFNVNKNNDGMYISAMDIHPNNRSVIVSSKFGSSLIDTETGQIDKIDKGQSLGCNFSKNGQYLAISIKSWAGKTTCLALYEDKQFANSTYNSTSNNKDEGTPEVSSKEYLYESSVPKFSVVCHAEPTESRKKSKKDRLTVTMKSTTKDLAGTITAIELPSSIKEEKYPGLTTKIAEKFVEKKDYEIIEKETIQIEGAEGIRYLLKLNNLYYEYRGVTTKGYNYQLVFIYDQKVTDLAPVNKFFNSFNIKK